MYAAIFKVIYGIPLWLTGLAARFGALSFRFLAELLGILLFKAKWWIVSLSWLFVLWGLVKLEPTIRGRLPHPIWAVYIRLIVIVMGLVLLAYVTKNLRRRWRRAKLELKVLSTVSDAKKHIIEVRGGGSGGGSGGGGGGGFISRMRARVREKRDLNSTVQTVEGDVETSVEAMVAQVAADAQAQVDEMLAGEQPAKREAWSLGLKDKPRSSAYSGGAGRGAKKPAKAQKRDPVAEQLENLAEQIAKLQEKLQ